MIYFRLNNEKEVVYVHYMPFDEKNGLNKTVEELNTSGFLVEEIPQFAERIGFTTVIKYENNTFYPIYKEKPADIIRYEKLYQMVDEGRITQEEMNELL